MRDRFHISLLFVCALTLSACATSADEHVPLQKSARDELTSTEIVLRVPQSEIYLSLMPSETSSSPVIAPVVRGGFATGAIVGAASYLLAREIEAQAQHGKKVRALSDALVGYDFDSELRDAVGRSVAGIPWAHVDKVRVTKDAGQQSADAAVDSSGDSAVLVTIAQYYLADNASNLVIEFSAEMFPKTPNLQKFESDHGSRASDPRNAIYRQSFSYYEYAPNYTADQKSNIAIWTANNGAVLRTVLNRACEKIARKLTYDLQGEAYAADQARPWLRAGAKGERIAGGASRIG